MHAHALRTMFERKDGGVNTLNNYVSAEVLANTYAVGGSIGLQYHIPQSYLQMILVVI